MFLNDAITTDHAAQGCTCCGRKLNPKTAVWLELSFKSGKWHKNEGECPEDESQGWHIFGPACAKTTIKQQQ